MNNLFTTEQSYKMVPNGSTISSEEIESTNHSIEIIITWGESVLKVINLTPPKNFYIGEYADFFLPEEKLGKKQIQLVSIDNGVTTPNGPLHLNGSTKISISNFTFHITYCYAGRQTKRLQPLASTGIAYTALSFLLHAFLLGSVALFVPTLNATTEDEITQDQQILIRQYLATIADKEIEARQEQLVDNNSADSEGGTGKRARGEEGTMGNLNSHATGFRYGVAGPKDNPDPHVARQSALRDAGGFGMIGLLNSGAGGDPNAPTAVWGRDDSLGNDFISARGNMWGSEIGDAFGSSGLGLSGIGDGGGGRGEGIRLSDLGTVGHGSGLGTDQGFGRGHGHLGGRHQLHVPTVRMGTSAISGHIPPEVIQRIVRQNFGRFRLCYENGLRNNPALQGRVSVNFIIGRDGSVSNVGNGGSDLPDSAVLSCVQKAFYGLSFPQPDTGIVRVNYPILFSPSN